MSIFVFVSIMFTQSFAKLKKNGVTGSRLLEGTAKHLATVYSKQGRRKQASSVFILLLVLLELVERHDICAGNLGTGQHVHYIMCLLDE